MGAACGSNAEIDFVRTACSELILLFMKHYTSSIFLFFSIRVLERFFLFIFSSDHSCFMAYSFHQQCNCSVVECESSIIVSFKGKTLSMERVTIHNSYPMLYLIL